MTSPNFKCNQTKNRKCSRNLIRDIVANVQPVLSRAATQEAYEQNVALLIAAGRKEREARSIARRLFNEAKQRLTGAGE